MKNSNIIEINRGINIYNGEIFRLLIVELLAKTTSSLITN